jgi:quinol monooxygenase YgiN
LNLWLENCGSALEARAKNPYRLQHQQKHRPKSAIQQFNKDPQIKKTSVTMVYTIVVHMYAKPEAEAISKLKAKLVEASQVYSKDKETLSWFVMQDVHDERKFTIVERYLQESVRTHSLYTLIA